MTAFY